MVRIFVLILFILNKTAYGQIESIWPKKEYFDSVQHLIDSSWAILLSDGSAEKNSCLLIRQIQDNKISYKDISFYIYPEYCYKKDVKINHRDICNKLFFVRRGCISCVAYHDSLAYYMILMQNKIKACHGNINKDDWQVSIIAKLTDGEFSLIKQDKHDFLIMPFSTLVHFYFINNKLMMYHKHEKKCLSIPKFFKERSADKEIIDARKYLESLK